VRGGGPARGSRSQARARAERDPTDLDAAIWYGRRLAYLGHYAEAIDVYTGASRGIGESPRAAGLDRAERGPQRRFAAAVLRRPCGRRGLPRTIERRALA